MCSRYVLSLNSFELEKQFGWAVREHFDASNNIAPSEKAGILRKSADDIFFQTAAFGYNTGWTNGPKFLLNLKSETVLEKKFAASAVKNSRCILPASGFIEWLTNSDKTKTPVLFETADKSIFGLGGLIFTNKNKQTECVILTTGPNDTAARVHNRMPVMISPDNWEKWLSDTDYQALIAGMAVPFQGPMTAQKLNTSISKASYKGGIVREDVL